MRQDFSKSRRQGNATSERKVIIRKHRADYKIVLYMGLLVMLGLILLFAISPYQIARLNADGSTLSQSYYMIKQLVYLGIGLAAFIAAAVIPISFITKYKNKLLLGAIGVCLLLTLLGVLGLPPALCFNGACRWYDVGFGTFQPAEFLKFALFIFMASFIAYKAKIGKLNDIQDTIVPLAVVLIVAIVLVVLLQKDMGTGITILGCLAAMIYASGMRLKLLAAGLAALGGLGLLLIVTSAHRMERVMTLFNPGAASDASNYHIEMATVAIGSGGFLGRGLGNGVQAFGYLPEALNDSIFAVLGETFGFVGLLFVLGLFVALLLRIVKVAERTEDMTMRLLAYGAFGWIATHVVVNVGAMIGVFPLTGVTLPFLSFGGTSLLFIMATLGIVYQVSKYTAHAPLTTKEPDASTDSRRGIGRTRHAGSRGYQRA